MSTVAAAAVLVAAVVAWALWSSGFDAGANAVRAEWAAAAAAEQARVAAVLVEVEALRAERDAAVLDARRAAGRARGLSQAPLTEAQRGAVEAIR
jgi:hypothetical protein